MSCHAMEAVSDSPSGHVTAAEAVWDFLSCPGTAMEAACDSRTCSATAPETRKALPVLSVSTLPVLSVSALSVLSVSVSPQISDSDMGSCLVYGPTPVWWAPVPSAPPWGAPVPSAPPRWVPGLSAPPWGAPVPSAPPWGAPVPSAPPRWAPGPSAPPWGAPVPSTLPWWAPVPSSPPWLPHGPGPPSLPLFRLRSTAHLGLFRSVWKPLLGGGGGAMSRIVAMNIVPLTTRGHSSITGLSLSYRSLIDYISHQSLHPHSCSQLSRLHLISISQSPSPNHTHTHTLHKPWTFSHSLPSIVSLSAYQAFS